MKEKSFLDAYGLDVEIYCENKLDKDFNWIKASIDFIVDGKTYNLTEIFNDGADNSTKYVIYKKEGHQIKHSKFVDAEKDLVIDILRKKVGV